MSHIPKEASPFTPGRPVPVEFFVGRSKELDRALWAVKETAAGNPRNVYVSGERGIGKSSLASVVRRAAESEFGCLGVHAFLSAASTLHAMVRSLFQHLLTDHLDTPLMDRLKSLFGERIKQVGLFGVVVQFQATDRELRETARNLLPVLANLYEKLKSGRRALLLILDDINGLAQSAEFANFLKSLVDENSVRRKPVPLSIFLVGLPERRDQLLAHQPSLGRIFDVIDIQSLSADETEEFYRQSFRAAKMTVEPDAMRTLCTHSGGLPMLLHEVGDAVFLANTDGRVDVTDAMRGIVDAAEIVGRKYLDRQVFQAIRSDRYRTILHRLVGMDVGPTFLKRDVAKHLGQPEQRVFDNFLRRMKALGVLRPGAVRGEYRFANELFHLYMRLAAKTQEGE